MRRFVGPCSYKNRKYSEYIAWRSCLLFCAIYCYEAVRSWAFDAGCTMYCVRPLLVSVCLHIKYPTLSVPYKLKLTVLQIQYHIRGNGCVQYLIVQLSAAITFCSDILVRHLPMVFLVAGFRFLWSLNGLIHHFMRVISCIIFLSHMCFELIASHAQRERGAYI